MYGKAKVGKPDWYMMGACIVFALTFSLRSVPLAVLLLLFMPFSLLSLTGELPLPTRNAPIFQTLLCISIPLLVIGAFSSLLLLLPKLLIPSACVWLFGGALMLFLPPGAFRKSRMAMYWAVICFAAVVALLIMLLQRYQAYGDLYEGLSYDILRVMMNARTHFNPRSPHGERLRKVTILSIRIIGFAQKVYHKTVLLRISLAENAVILPKRPRNPVRTSLQKAGGLRFARAIRAARPYSISSPSGA